MVVKISELRISGFFQFRTFVIFRVCRSRATETSVGLADGLLDTVERQ